MIYRPVGGMAEKGIVALHSLAVQSFYQGDSLLFSYPYPRSLSDSREVMGEEFDPFSFWIYATDSQRQFKFQMSVWFVRFDAPSPVLKLCFCVLVGIFISDFPPLCPSAFLFRQTL